MYLLLTNNIISYYLLGSCIVITIFLFVLKNLNFNKTKMKRSISFVSESCLSGVFPKNAPVTPTIITGVLFMKKCPEILNIIHTCSVLLKYDRMRSVVKNKNGKCDFYEIELNIADLIETVYVSSQEELELEIDRISNSDFDDMSSKPLWRIYRVVNSNGISSLLFRVHHGIGDGMALLAAMSQVFKNSDGSPFTVEVPEKMKAGLNKNASRRNFFHIIFQFVTNFFKLIMIPNSTHDSNSLFVSREKSNINMTSRKNILFPKIPLQLLKDLKISSKSTINDVLLAITTGMIRRYCNEKNDPIFKNNPSKLQSRVLMPVAFPRTKEELESSSHALRNYFAFASVETPINEITPMDRVRVCQQFTQAVKSSPIVLIQLFMQTYVLPLLPKFLSRQIAYDTFVRHTMVFSNVPGPGQIISIAGEPIEGMQVIYPNQIPQVIAVSYNQYVYFNLNINPEVVVESHELPRFFMDELRDLGKQLNINVSDYHFL